MLIRCTRKILWNLFLLVGDLQDFYEYFITEIRNKTNENRKNRQFLWNLFLRLIIRKCFAEFIFMYTKNNSILLNLLLRFRDKCAEINAALINSKKINFLKVISKLTMTTSLNIKIKLFLPNLYIGLKFSVL